MDLANKTIPWMVASLLTATTLFGNNQSCQQPKKSEPNCPPSCQPVEPLCQPQVCKPAKCGRIQEPQTPTIPAYNAPAETNIGMLGEWDFFVEGSFLYWQRVQDDMRLGTKDSFEISDLNTSGFKGKTIDMGFDFDPGFKVGLGMNFRNDNWVGYVEYTRVHGESDTSASTATPRIYSAWGDLFPFTDQDNSTFFVEFGGPGFVFTSAKGEFNCNQDFIDPTLERVYFVGKELIFHSAFGARIALISESLNARYGYSGALTPTPGSEITNKFALPCNMNVVNRTNSWAIGPRMGLEMDWKVTRGIRLFGSGFLDVLYTRYKVQTKTSLQPFATTGSFVAGNTITSTNRDEFGTIRAHVDLEGGLGWGTYLDYNSWHVDLSAAYGFQVFFNQNVMRLPSYSPSNLYVQGLTFTARLDY